MEDVCVGSTRVKRGLSSDLSFSVLFCYFTCSFGLSEDTNCYFALKDSTVLFQCNLVTSRIIQNKHIDRQKTFEEVLTKEAELSEKKGRKEGRFFHEEGKHWKSTGDIFFE